MDTVALLARVAFSLAVVIGLMWACAVVLRGRQRTSRTAGTLSVVSRVPVGKHSSVAVLSVADRHLVIGVTPEHITVLADLAAPQQEAAAVAAVVEPRRTTIVLPSVPATTADSSATAVVTSVSTPGALTGSILSPTTWKQTVDLLRERTVRR